MEDKRIIFVQAIVDSNQFRDSGQESPKISFFVLLKINRIFKTIIITSNLYGLYSFFLNLEHINILQEHIHLLSLFYNNIYQLEANRMSETADDKRRSARLPPQVNKIIYVRNLPYKITAQQLYDVFGRFGPVRQIRKGKAGDKKGTAFIVYQDIYDAKNAVQNLNGFNVGGRYLIALYYSAKRLQLIKQATASNNANNQ